jgi:ankyrin repeat protein
MSLESAANFMNNAVMGLKAKHRGEGHTPLMEAAFRGRLDEVLALMPFGGFDARDENGMTPLMLAAYSGHAECVEALLPVSDPSSVSNGNGRNALRLAAMQATSNGHVECIRALMRATDVNAQGHDGGTALMDAVHTGNVDAVALIASRADLDAKDSQQRTADDFVKGWTADEPRKSLERAMQAARSVRLRAELAETAGPAPIRSVNRAVSL